MINLGGYYYINEEDVTVISKGKGTEEYPFSLTVYTRGGEKCGVRYKDKGEMEREAIKIAEKVDQIRSPRSETPMCCIYNKLNLMDAKLEQIDKRGLRIWRQLKEILGAKMDGEVQP